MAARQLAPLPKLAIATGTLGTLWYALVQHDQSKHDNSKLYQDAVEALQQDEYIVNALGRPVTTFSTDLDLQFDTSIPMSEKTFSNNEECQLKIPLRGRKHDGHLYARCKYEQPSGECVMSALYVVANGQRADVMFSVKKEEPTDKK